jgi:hypothetical protein
VEDKERGIEMSVLSGSSSSIEGEGSAPTVHVVGYIIPFTPSPLIGCF